MSFYWYIDGVRYPHPPDLVREERHVNKISEGSPVNKVNAEQLKLPDSTYYKNKTRKHNSTNTQITANDIMTYPVITAIEHITMLEAWDIIQQHRFRHLPITDQEKKIKRHYL